jgi:hypothetical protein
MKTKDLPFILAFLAFTLISLQANARIWRVNNRSNYNGTALFGSNFGGNAAYPVFQQVNQAVAYAIVNNGDTLHVEGSPEIYSAATVTKKLVLIGTGYFLTENPHTSNTTLESKISRIFFSAGSEGSQAIGLAVVEAGNTADATIYAQVDGITIKRCRIESAVAFGTNLTDVYIVQNFFANTTSSNVLQTNGNTFFVPPANISFNNNICQKTLLWGSPITNPTTFWPVLQCNNNIFDGPDNLATPSLAFSTGEFRNNILMAGNAVANISASAGVIAYNVGSLPTQFGTSDNNIVVPAITTLFVSPASIDGAYMLQPGSQASNNGSDGTDRGAYGGASASNHYTLSGLAAIPVIYDVTTAGVTSGDLNVTIKARTIK